MKIELIIVALLAASWASIAFAADAPAARSAAATQPAAAAFEKIKNLAGEWKGKKPDGSDVGTSFKVAAANSAVVEDMHMDMVSVYTLDNERVVMTHYCAAQNQPRMIADAIQPDAKSLSFHFLDATGMKSPDEGRMQAMKLTFVDPDHVNEEWTWREGGKDKSDEVMKFERVKK